VWSEESPLPLPSASLPCLGRIADAVTAGRTGSSGGGSADCAGGASFARCDKDVALLRSLSAMFAESIHRDSPGAWESRKTAE
jgi:hypothetical protein